MHEDLIEKLVNEILYRLKKKVLILLTAADGYQDIIFSRLQCCQDTAFTIIIPDNAREFHDENSWNQLGPIIHTSAIIKPGHLDFFDAIYIPFLDFITLSEVANGLFHSEAATVIHHALMSNKPVICLSYNCNPNSELNQIKGLSRGAPETLFTDSKKALTKKGILFRSLDQMIDKKSILEDLTPANLSNTSPYITLSEVVNHNRDYSGERRLTDLAREYLREKNTMHK